MEKTQIDFVTPVAPGKDLGAEYNRAMGQSTCPWVCIRDCDTMFLTPMSGILAEMLRYIEVYPKCGLFTCLTNRIWTPEQQLDRKFSEDRNIENHIILAESQLTECNAGPVCEAPISGFLMLIKKNLWEKVGGFPEGGKFLGVDNRFCEDCRKAGSPPRVMHSIYVFHIYRMREGREYKKHLL